MRNLFRLCLLLLLPTLLFAQNTRYDGQVISSRGGGVPFANVAVCTQPATISTQPCSPLATIFSTVGGAAQANPLTTDINGNFHFYAVPGSVFTLQIYSPQINTYVMTDINIPISTSASNTFTVVQIFNAGITGTGNIGTLGLGTTALAANNSWTGNETHSGTETFTGLMQCKSFENVQCVDSTLSRGGTDLGNEINLAYAALPPTGGTIWVFPNSSGTAYSFSTAIALNTNNKIASLRGAGTGPVQATYTGTGSAITIQWGGQHFPEVAVQNIRITGPGSGGSVVGIQVGTNATFTDQVTLDQLYLTSFGIGISIVGGTAFDITLKNSSLLANGNGLTAPSGVVALYLDNSLIAQNTNCGLLFATGPVAVKISGGDIEQNGSSATTGSICLTGTSMNFHSYGVHYENTTPGSAGPFIYSSGSNNNINVNGGDFLLDAQAATTVAQVINFAGGDTLNVDSTSLNFGTGITLTQAILSQAGNCTIFTRFRLGQVPGSVVGGSGGGPCFNIINQDSAAGLSGTVQSFKLKGYQARAVNTLSDQGNICTNGELALSAGWQSTGTATVGSVAGNGQTCSWTITTGTTTAANPTITDTLVNPLPAATTVCWMNIYGGTHTAIAGESLRQTTLSATAPVFTANFTPTAAGTTYFITRSCGP